VIENGYLSNKKYNQGNRQDFGGYATSGRLLRSCFNRKRRAVELTQQPAGVLRKFITANDNWLLVGRYIDEGLSAITTAKRENFHTMIADAKAGNFDFVITKEISRFARNTLDAFNSHVSC